MSRLSRRWFLGGAAAAACVGCDGGSDDPSGVDPSTSTSAATGGTNADRATLPGLVSSHTVGPLDEVTTAASVTPLYVPEARAHLVAMAPADASALSEAVDARLRPGLDHGLLALYQKCPHLGCRVPFCDTSGWFECACHGTMFTSSGEHRTGPGPRGLDAFPVTVDDGIVAIDTGDVVDGLPLGTVVIDRGPAGPHCVGSTADR